VIGVVRQTLTKK